MFKLQPASQKELSRIARGTVVLTAVMWVVFALLGMALPALLRFDYRMVVGSALGTLVAIGNFAALCAMVEKASADPERAKGIIKLSYNQRLLVQAVWCVLALTLPFVQPVAGVLPLLFPRVVIFYLQITGVYRKEADQEALKAQPDEPAPADDASDPDEGGEK